MDREKVGWLGTNVAIATTGLAVLAVAPPAGYWREVSLIAGFVLIIGGVAGSMLSLTSARDWVVLPGSKPKVRVSDSVLQDAPEVASSYVLFDARVASPERVFSPRTARELLDIARSAPTTSRIAAYVAPYIDTWLHTRGMVEDVDGVFRAISLRIRPDPDDPTWGVSADFAGDGPDARLLATLARGDVVAVEGVIDSISAWTVSLREARIISVVNRPAPDAEADTTIGQPNTDL
jgi:hypothetical protein